MQIPDHFKAKHPGLDLLGRIRLITCRDGRADLVYLSLSEKSNILLRTVGNRAGTAGNALEIDHLLVHGQVTTKYMDKPLP